MVAKSGDTLLKPDAIEAIRDRLVPMADIITPNLKEASVLLASDIPASVIDMKTALPRLYALGAEWVLLKGGYLPGYDSVDFLYGDGKTTELHAPRIETKNVHGTGCTLSAAIAAFMTRMPAAGKRENGKRLSDESARGFGQAERGPRSWSGSSLPCHMEVKEFKNRKYIYRSAGYWMNLKFCIISNPIFFFYGRE